MASNYHDAQNTGVREAYAESRERYLRRKEAHDMVVEMQSGETDGFDHQLLLGKHRGRIDRSKRQVVAEPLILNLPPSHQTGEHG